VKVDSKAVRAAALMLLVLLLGVVTQAGAQTPKAANAKPAASADIEDRYLDELYDEAEKGVVEIADPIAPWNRIMFEFNDRLYFWVLKPVARGYRFVVPTEIRTCLKNVFHNLGAPVRVANCLLQGKWNGAWSEFFSFFLNSTVGGLGLGNVAERFPGLVEGDEDFGQTLAKGGIGNGIYIVWPVFGPSTLRDTVGMAADRFLTPTSYIDPSLDAIAVSAVKTVNDTSFRIGDYETVKESAIDPYEAFRDFYIQYRNRKILE
jgi:phospholipid-binding lipoprotein MlaA